MGGFLEELLMYFSSVCICVCVCSVFAACCPYLMVWFGFHYVASGGFCSESSHCNQLPCGWSETICSRRILNILQQWRVWHSLNGAYAASIDFHIWEHLYYCWSPIRALQATKGLGLLEHSWSSRLNDRLPALWARSYAVCLERHHCGWDFTTLNVWQKTASIVCKLPDYTGGFPAPVPLIQSILQITLAIWFLAENDRFRIG